MLQDIAQTRRCAQDDTPVAGRDSRHRTRGTDGKAQRSFQLPVPVQESNKRHGGFTVNRRTILKGKLHNKTAAISTKPVSSSASRPPRVRPAGGSVVRQEIPPARLPGPRRREATRKAAAPTERQYFWAARDTDARNPHRFTLHAMWRRAPYG